MGEDFGSYETNICMVRNDEDLNSISEEWFTRVGSLVC